MTIREYLAVRTPAFLSHFFFVVDVVVGPVVFALAVLAVKKCFWQPTKFRQQTYFNRSENRGKPFLLLFSLYFVSAFGFSLSWFVFPFPLLLALYLYKLCDVFRYTDL